MTRIIFTYGLISGFVVIAVLGAALLLTGGQGHSVWLGYLVMLVALSSILVGVKQYRDRTLGGVISFRTALLLGLGIALVASLAYTVLWEGYDAATGRSFMGHYIEATLAAKRAAGASAAEYAKAVTEMQQMRASYANPLFRLPMVFLEIFPVGLVIALVSAVLLRNPKFLPARSRPVAA